MTLAAAFGGPRTPSSGIIPDQADAFTEHDLFTPTFPRMCMNRLQLRDNQQMVDLTDPTSAIVLAAPLVNLLFPHRR